MYGSEDIFFYNFFRNNDCVLKIVSFPGHECNHEIPAQRKLSIFCCIAFAQNLSFNDLVTFSYDRSQVYTGILVGTCKFGQLVYTGIIIKTYKAFLLIPFVTNDDFFGIYIFNNTIAFSINEDP